MSKSQACLSFYSKCEQVQSHAVWLNVNLPPPTGTPSLRSGRVFAIRVMKGVINAQARSFTTLRMTRYISYSLRGRVFISMQGQTHRSAPTIIYNIKFSRALSLSTLSSSRCSRHSLPWLCGWQ